MARRFIIRRAADNLGEGDYLLYLFRRLRKGALSRIEQRQLALRLRWTALKDADATLAKRFLDTIDDDCMR